MLRSEPLSFHPQEITLGERSTQGPGQSQRFAGTEPVGGYSQIGKKGWLEILQLDPVEGPSRSSAAGHVQEHTDLLHRKEIQESRAGSSGQNDLCLSMQPVGYQKGSAVIPSVLVSQGHDPHAFRHGQEALRFLYLQLEKVCGTGDARVVRPDELFAPKRGFSFVHGQDLRGQPRQIRFDSCLVLGGRGNDA